MNTRDKLSLYPLKFKKAVKGLLQTMPAPKEQKPKASKRPKKK